MRILSPAKINLLLKVLGKRNDGYHELLTLMVPVTLFDTLYLEQSAKGIELDAPGCGCSASDNLVFKAADLFRHKTEIGKGIKKAEVSRDGLKVSRSHWKSIEHQEVEISTSPL